MAEDSWLSEAKARRQFRELMTQASSPNASDFFAGRGFPRYRRLMFCYDPSRQGRPMKQPIERRLAAILAADVAGYSRLMGLDEAGAALAVREHHAAADPLIAQHGGRIVKTTGDGS